MMSFSEDADPRYLNKSEPSEPKKGLFSGGGEKKDRARIAFTGEEFGFGYQATQSFIERARRDGTVPDAGETFSAAEIEREQDEATKNSRFDYNAYIPQPLRTKEQALLAVKSQNADFAIVPFYHPYSGYDFETLRAMGSLSTLVGVQQISATDRMCLAVHESQLFDQIQSAHPGSGFSSLQRRMRKSWGEADTGSGNAPAADYQAEMPRAGLPIDMADQKLIRDRITSVFSGPDAARRCKSKLDGLRAIGISVQETAQMVEPHRELAQLARSTANPNRQTNTFFDPTTGETRFFSSLGAESQSGDLYGMVLPYEVAMRSSDYVIIDHDFDDAPPDNTRFMAVEINPDHSLFEDKYRTTDARTRYWGRRMNAVSGAHESLGAGIWRFLGFAAATCAVLLAILAVYGTGAIGVFDERLTLGMAQRGLTSIGAGLLAAILGVGSLLLMSASGRGQYGVRLMLRFKRDGTAASIGDVEDFLRNYGIRHSVVRMDEDSQRDKPAGIVLDVEFDPDDFSYGPFSMFSRRFRGSVVNGALKKAFQRWKNRGVTVLAAMPFEADESQLPKHKPRRWWSDAVQNWMNEQVETWFIRMARVGMPILAALALVWFAFNFFK